ncbi:MAG: TIGR04076 family protein [Gemmatimonadetes bacterium]|nr:TIGR04076 family protein [Gemmatimonadota bacterium]
MSSSDEFTLYDLKVEVVGNRGRMMCHERIGDFLTVSGGRLALPSGGSFPIYALAALLPLLPAKQRETHPNDWMTTDSDIACPDVHCGAVYRITRTGRRTFRHSEESGEPLSRDE